MLALVLWIIAIAAAAFGWWRWAWLFFAMGAVAGLFEFFNQWLQLQHRRTLPPPPDPVREVEAKRMLEEEEERDALRSQLQQFPEARCQNCSGVHPVTPPLLGELRCPTCDSKYLEPVKPDFKPYDKDYGCPECRKTFVQSFRTWEDQENAEFVYCPRCGTAALAADVYAEDERVRKAARRRDLKIGIGLAAALIVFGVGVWHQDVRESKATDHCTAISKPAFVPDLLRSPEFRKLPQPEQIRKLSESSMQFCKMDSDAQVQQMRHWGLRE